MLLNMVSAQANALAQADGARFLGLIVLVCSPLALLVRRSAKAAAPAIGVQHVQAREQSLSVR
jgi:hypothetical protein